MAVTEAMRSDARTSTGGARPAMESQGREGFDAGRAPVAKGVATRMHRCGEETKSRDVTK
jgi:hypothetical protein